MTLFHFAPIELGPGSIISPGNFGRIISSTQIAIQGGDSSLIAGYVGRELMFELIRVQRFPAKPSRLRAVFGCPSIEDARAYIGNDKRQVLHEVEVVDIGAAVHTAPISHCDITIGLPFIETMKFRAEQYWSSAPGDPARGNELVVESALRVIQPV